MQIRENVNLASFTTFNIGGPVSRFVQLNNISDIKQFIERFRDKQYFCLGEGSNILFPDHRFQKPVVTLGEELAEVEFDGETAKAGAGLFLPGLVHETTRKGLSGLEWAAGIPGSLGGAIMMNAGARGDSIMDIVTEITYLDKQGNISKISPGELDYGYRDSDLPGDILILFAQLEFESCEREKATRSQLDNLRERRLSQPVEVPSAGSVFKNPPGNNAGALIEKSGLKGVTAGGAKISEKHANFIINKENAQATDVLELIERARKQVLENFDVELELEICIPWKIS